MMDQLQQTAFNRIQQLFANKIGLLIHNISLPIWQRKLSERMNLLGLSTYESYYLTLINSPNEFQELIELLIVPESWFFRDKPAFDYLIYHLKHTSKLHSVSNKVNILSLPCSSGEEAYSIAMALLEAKFPENTFSVDAIDISKKALEKAEKGIYRKNSFRGKSNEYRDIYFNKIDDAFVLDDKVRRQVHFSHGNIFSGLNQSKISYDAIFCRNLLIYMHEEAQRLIFFHLTSLLAPGGVLFVGSAEVEIARRNHYTSIGPGRAYALKHLIEASSKTPPPKKQPKTLLSLASPKQSNEMQIGKLEEAKKLADNGHFQEATDLSMEYLKKYGADADAYFLLGVIKHAVHNEEEAQKYFLKTVYLNPYHYKALVYLALLAEVKGNLVQAAALRERVKRAEPKK